MISTLAPRGKPHDASDPRSALKRAATLLLQRMEVLEDSLQADHDSVWPAYCDVVRSLTAALNHVLPGAQGELLTTREMAARLNLTPKTLLRHCARGRVRPAVKSGKLVRWRGDELPL
jgi:hypothetical protein